MDCMRETIPLLATQIFSSQYHYTNNSRLLHTSTSTPQKRILSPILRLKLYRTLFLRMARCNSATQRLLIASDSHGTQRHQDNRQAVPHHQQTSTRSSFNVALSCAAAVLVHDGRLDLVIALYLQVLLALPYPDVISVTE